MSSIMRKPAAEQLPSNWSASKRLCFFYIDSTIPLLLNLKFQASSNLLCLHSPLCLGPGQETLKTDFLAMQLIICDASKQNQ